MKAWLDQWAHQPLRKILQLPFRKASGKRLILHIGMPKTGTSALQDALFRNHSALLEAGVLYPAFKEQAHNILVAGYAPPDRLPRHLANRYSGRPQKARKDFEVWWEHLRNQIATAGPSVILLSGESLFTPLVRHRRQLIQLVLSLCDEVSVVAYVRRPSDYYLSRTQQHLKGSSTIRPPAEVHFRNVIESYQAEFPVHVAPYLPNAFQDGSIVSDFVHRFVPEAVPVLADIQADKQNESMSAEGMALMQDYRRSELPDQDNVFTPQSAVVLRALMRASAACDAPRPKLFGPVADFVDRSSVDLLWLRDEFGVVFPDLDYSRIGTEVPPLELAEPILVSDIALVDPEIKARILNKVLHHFASEGGKGRDRREREE